MKTELKYKNRKELADAKKRNAKIYPLYKAFSWDFIFYYSTQYLFFTVTKGISPGVILQVNAFYPLFILLMQLPATICGDLLGRKKSIVIGNIMVSLHVLALIILQGVAGLFIANIIMAFGYSLKTIQETNLLYDSSATRGGSGLYPKINARGASGYYILDGIASLVAGYLFVINGYLPMIICFIFTIISIIISLRFKDIYVNKLEERTISNRLKEYKEDFKISMKNIIKSRRLRALLIFMGIFNSAITIFSTYKGNIMTELDIRPESFSIINAVLTCIQGISTMLEEKIHKKFRNKSLAVLSIVHTMTMLIIGILVCLNVSNIIPIVLILFAIRAMAYSNYFVLIERYSKNFSTPKTRVRISFSIEFVTNIIETVLVFFAGLLLDNTNINFALISSTLFFLMLTVLALDYMRTRVGLKPEQYRKEDIELE